MLGTTLVVLSYSLLNPVLAVRLQQAGASSTAIGIVAMLPFVAVALLVPIVPALFARIGVGQAYRLGLALELVACLGYLLTDHYGVWCVLGLMAGMGAAAAWNATEGLIAHNVPPSHRGRLTGLYQTLLGAAMAVGPLLPGLLRLSPVMANVLAALGLAAGLALTLSPAVRHLRASHVDQAHMSLLSAWRFRPALGWAAVVGGVFEVGLGSITTAYGSQIGLNLAAATSIAGAVGIGSFILQYPTGWLADHVRSRHLFASGAALLLLSALAFVQAAHWPVLIWVCAVVWGAVGGALYTLSMIRVAHDFADTSALAGTSAMIAGYTAGGALGPLVSGWMLDHFGVGGQGWWLGALALSLLLMQGRRPSSPTDDC
ncbi:MAG TPA: MFS transporter [Aquabacterium sp.]|uniref:MFS transporter n=1 Tax=Aquabacterium sp. TaxID=1872578 RepID=UPI002E2F7147|nr:MFS transporter [Aquabacterium sp.]HEX5373804.1 MFS transporter [Aquabacterium sp.]